ncbi:PREDICTED: serine/threonine-protein kinase 24 [Cercocebus atys]|uniref:serine/threonine-protein kinase 24 n=1 Tax=Cercocebus atys TaxID=9531 RepID=UPI0005F53616|nr:PREDICTED: serine/threonine-protein kinase 24 [Cercocebus atys]
MRSSRGCATPSGALASQNLKADPEELFTKLEKIGKGSFGEVFKGIDNRTQKVVAIKIIDLEEAEDEIEDIQQEITVLSQCDSPYVTKYYGSYLKDTKLWIIMEYLGGGSALDLVSIMLDTEDTGMEVGLACTSDVSSELSQVPSVASSPQRPLGMTAGRSAIAFGRLVVGRLLMTSGAIQNGVPHESVPFDLGVRQLAGHRKVRQLHLPVLRQQDTALHVRKDLPAIGDRVRDRQTQLDVSVSVSTLWGTSRFIKLTRASSLTILLRVNIGIESCLVFVKMLFLLQADIWSLGITAIELARGEPPHSELHPMKVLFLIPKNNPPTLEGNYSKPLKEFVEACLNKEPSFRPTAKELLKHKFILRNAKKTSYLTELIDRYKRWKAEQSHDDSSSEDSDAETDGQASGGSDSGDWIFTIREKDPKNLENGALQPSDLDRNKMKDIPKRPFSQCLSTIISPLFAELKEKSQACGGNLGSIEELRGAIYLAEEACPGISDTMVAQLVQRLQRYSLSGGGTSSH